MFQPRCSRSGGRGVSPYRRPTSPELPPYPGDCEDRPLYRFPSPTGHYRRSADYGSRFNDYPFSSRDYSPQRVADYSRPRDYRPSGDYHRRDYEQQLREGSPRPDGNFEDYFCRDNNERGRFSERRVRAPSTDRDRDHRAVATEKRSPKRYIRTHSFIPYIISGVARISPRGEGNFHGGPRQTLSKIENSSDLTHYFLVGPKITNKEKYRLGGGAP